MALLAEYIKDLENQKKLINDLSNSGPALPGLGVDQILDNIAKLDQNLKDTTDYYNSVADRLSQKEEQAAADSGVEETEEQKQTRRRKKREEAAKKIEETTDKFRETLRDFVNEQVAIIKVNWGVISEEVAEIPKTITLGLATAAQPAAIGAAAPNPFFNLGLLYQILSSIKRSVNTIKTAFLNMLIAADKIKFALPKEVTGTLQKILDLQKLIGRKSPKPEAFEGQPIPEVPNNTEVTLDRGEYSKGLRGTKGDEVGGYVSVTSDNVFGIRRGTRGTITEVIMSEGVITGVRIRIGDYVPPETDEL